MSAPVVVSERVIQRLRDDLAYAERLLQDAKDDVERSAQHLASAQAEVVEQTQAVADLRELLRSGVQQRVAAGPVGQGGHGGMMGATAEAMRPPQVGGAP